MSLEVLDNLEKKVKAKNKEREKWLENRLKELEKPVKSVDAEGKERLFRTKKVKVLRDDDGEVVAILFEVEPVV